MTVRVQIGWRVPRDEWDAFIEYVEDKWDAQGPYVRFELESAMREFLDADGDLAEAEALLRRHLQSQGLSSSTDAVPSDLSHGDTVKLGHRINADLKDEFAKMAKEHYSDSLGAVLARAVNAYRGGGRRRRILDNVKQLVTGGTTSGSTAESDESDRSSESHAGTTGVAIESTSGTDESAQSSSGTTGGTTDDADESVVVEPQLVMDIADELPDNGFPEQLLQATIAKTVAGDAKTIEAYTNPVCNQKNVVKHPHKDGVYITETAREQTTYWTDLNRELRVTKLRRLVVLDALDKKKQRHGLKYRDVQALFEEYYSAAPSHDYAYTLMEDAGRLDGFSYKRHNGSYQLRVNLTEVQDGIIEDVLDEWDTVDKENLTVNGLITSYSAGPTPDQEAAADD